MATSGTVCYQVPRRPPLISRRPSSEGGATLGESSEGELSVGQASVGAHVRRGRDYGLCLSRIVSTCVLWISVPLTDAALVHLVTGAVRELERELEGARRGARRTRGEPESDRIFNKEEADKPE